MKSSTKSLTDPSSTVQIAVEVLRTEIRGLEAVQSRLDERFSTAVDLMFACEGRVIVTGVGKSGQVAKKISSTLTSTGTPSLYLHPVEAAHGDMGILTAADVVLLVSYSGANEEFAELMAVVHRMDLPLVTLTGRANGRWPKVSSVVIDCAVPEEACPLNLAPTASSTACMAMGDALAVALLNRRGLQASEFASMHPSGVLGRQLLFRVKDVMQCGDALPRCKVGDSLQQALLEMAKKRLGCVFVDDTMGKLVGIITDGDLKRILMRFSEAMDIAVDTLMVGSPKTVSADTLAVQALQQMEENQGGAITQLAVVDENGRLTGAVHMHDIVRLGLTESPMD